MIDTKKIHYGDLESAFGVVYDFDEITGSLDASGADTKTAFPNLTTVGGYLDARGADTRTAFPKLTTVGGSLYAKGADTKTAFPNLTTVGGFLDACGADTKTAFPKLTTVGGSLDARGADTKTAFPKLTTVGGYLDARGADTKTAFPKLTTVGGSLYARGADTKTAFPKLTTVGGSLDAKGSDTPSIKQKKAGTDAITICHAALAASLLMNGFTIVDGILAELVSKKGNVSRVRIIGQTKISYIVQRDGRTAHGETLAQARADLLLKIGKRDTTPYESWTLETKVSLEEMIVAYRTITGACGQGVSHFLSEKNYRGKLSVAFVIEETNGRYGHEQFKGFFTK